MIHPITTSDTAADATEPMFAWETPDGDLVLLGERSLLTALADDLAAFLTDGTRGEPVSQYDLPGESYTIAAAVQEMLNDDDDDADQPDDDPAGASFLPDEEAPE